MLVLKQPWKANNHEINGWRYDDDIWMEKMHYIVHGISYAAGDKKTMDALMWVYFYNSNADVVLLETLTFDDRCQRQPRLRGASRFN